MTQDEGTSRPFASDINDPTETQSDWLNDNTLPPRTDATLDTPLTGNDSEPVETLLDDERPNSDKVASKIEETVADAQQKVSDVADGAGEKARQLADTTHGMSDKGIDSAASGLGQAATMLRQQGETHEGAVGTAATRTADTLEHASTYLREKDTDQLMSDLEALVRKRPVESVLVAAGVGFVLSKLLG
jgi:ElaB/YqjD/DUF883 family membrane-anchored ribosome-binding protein